jgi:hypothetical protein
MNDNFYSDLIELNDLNKLNTLLKSFWKFFLIVYT